MFDKFKRKGKGRGDKNPHPFFANQNSD